MLYDLQSFFSVGTIIICPRDGHGIYFVNSLHNLVNVIIPHFDKCPLLTKNKADYLLFKQVIAIMKNKEHHTIEGLIKIVSIRASMNWGLSEILHTNFPDVVQSPVVRQLVENKTIEDPN